MAIGMNGFTSQAASYVNAENSKAKSIKEKSANADSGKVVKTAKEIKNSGFLSGAVYEKSAEASSALEKSQSSKSQGYGRTVGTPKLSEEAEKYYNKLKAKYGNMDFVLVSSDMKDAARSQVASFANPNKMVVLIDEEKIEKMATDEEFRDKYEGLIAMAQMGMSSMKSSFGNDSDIKGYGMQVNDNGTASYFAVVKKLNDNQAERIKKKGEEKLEEKKAEQKKADKEAKEEALKKAAEDDEEIIDEDVEETDKVYDLFGYSEDDRYEIISASSVEELLSKVGAYTGKDYTSEAYSGSHIDYRA